MTNKHTPHPCFWQDNFTTPLIQLSPESYLSTDIAIIGGGFSGLWTAYYLKQQAPDLNISIFESERCGFGASGRNGGWLMGNLAGEDKWLPHMPLNEQDIARNAITGIIQEVKRVTTKENIQCDLIHGGHIQAATRYLEQADILKKNLSSIYQAGYNEYDYQWLDASDAQKHLNVNPCFGGIFTPHVAVIHPMKLLAGLLQSLIQQGVKIYEHTDITKIEPRLIHAGNCKIKSDIIVDASEAYNCLQPSARPYILPIQSQIICSEPLSDQLWDSLGLGHRQAFSDASRLVTYGQRTADNRILFGMRGSYNFGGKHETSFTSDTDSFLNIRKQLLEFFPNLNETTFPYHWQGSLGMSRSFSPHAQYDAHSGLASLGGYGGEGLGATNLMGRTLADMIFHKSTEISHMPWAKYGPLDTTIKKWEPEPIRWLSYKTVGKVLEVEERLCIKSARPHWLRKIYIKFAELIANLLH